ncbi:MAG: LysR substrate-binding domain-containing protein [Azospirillaceae bacterium]|nr:LysR substrate-binding domain-containing protein [Azospirillaceae bacterium]
MQFRQIDAFRAVMVSGTATQAAHLLRTSQPAISRLIAELEASIRITLFRRAHGRLLPTEEAKMLFIEVEKTYLSLDHLRRFSTSLRRHDTAYLQIGSIMSFALDFVPRVVIDFAQAAPDIHVSLATSASEPIRDRVASHQFDIGLTSDIVDVTGVEARSFSKDALIVVLPASHRLAARKILAPADLVDERLVSFGPETLMRCGIAEAFEMEGVDLQIAVDSPYAALLCNLVRHGGGIGIVHPFAALDFLERGLVMRRLTVTCEQHTLLLTPPRTPQPPHIEAFIDLLDEMRRVDTERVEAALAG